MTLFWINLQKRLIHIYEPAFLTTIFKTDRKKRENIERKMSDEAPPPYPGPKKEEESTTTPNGQNDEAKKAEEPFDNSKLPPPPPYSGLHRQFCWQTWKCSYFFDTLKLLLWN